MLQKNLSSDLIERFDKLKINPTDSISGKDRSFCENLQKEYDSLQRQLNKYVELFVKLNEEEKNNPYSLKSSEWREEYIELKDAPKWYERFMFTPLYPLQVCRKFLSEGRKRFIEEAGNYFERIYNLELNLDELIESEKPVCYQDVVEEIVRQVGEVSLNDSGIRNLINGFKNCVYYRNRVVIKSNKITIDNYVYYSYHSLPSLKIDRTDKQVNALIMAMSHFESGGVSPLHIITDNMPGRSYSDEVDPTMEYIFYHAEKIRSIKFFKNRRVDIKFTTNEYARKFYEYFELNTLQEK